MKTIDFINVKPSHKSEEHSDNVRLDLEKQEDISLPTFTKELPKSKKRKESIDTISIDYAWGKTTENYIHIKSIEFTKNEELDNIYRLNIYDGTDSAVIKLNGVLYIVRKTTMSVAKALLNVYKKISTLVENVVGYFSTVLGNSYSISRMETGSWTFDDKLTNYEAGIKFISPSTLTEKQKSKLFEVLIQKFLTLHSKNLILGKFTLKNILMSNTNVFFTDLRNLRLSRKASLVVEEFKSAIRYLLSSGIINRENVYPAIATYCVANESACREWYKEKLDGQANENSDTYDIATTIESEIYS